VTVDRVGALRSERAELLMLCRDLDVEEWRAPSAAPGWRVQDVVAHMGSGFHAMFSPAAQKAMRGLDIERANDVLVDRRPGWTMTSRPRWAGWCPRPRDDQWRHRLRDKVSGCHEHSLTAAAYGQVTLLS
jgi:uncharacterized protein (TIGR03083 family)